MECNSIETDVYLPTPEEIREGCREAQAAWTEAEREHRLAAKSPETTWRVPRVRAGHAQEGAADRAY